MYVRHVTKEVKVECQKLNRKCGPIFYKR